MSLPAEVGGGRIGGVPVRNIWLLFLYASDLARFGDRFDAALEDDDGDLATLAARILVHAVERRLRRNLSRGYRPRQAILTRVRGRIDPVRTGSRRLLDQGRVACRFEAFTFDTPRNRLVRAALEACALRVAPADLAGRCRRLAGDLGRSGVSAGRPGAAELAADVIGRNEAEDRLMLAAARLALEPALPTEAGGRTALSDPGRDDHAVRRLFERAVAGFYRTELGGRGSGWTVRAGPRLAWPVEAATAGAREILPSMQADIVLDRPAEGRRLVIDTKFTEIVKPGWRRARSLSPAHLYQIYAYLRSQAGRDPLADRAEGLLLHPAVGAGVDEEVVVQGHRIRFATVDLAAEAGAIRARLAGLALRPDLQTQEKSPTRTPG